MASGQNPAAHDPGIVVEFHLHKRRTHARNLSATFLSALKYAGGPERTPTEQPEPEQTDGDSGLDIPSESDEGAEPERSDPARRPDHPRDLGGELLRVGLGEGVHRPQ